VPRFGDNWYLYYLRHAQTNDIKCPEGEASIQRRLLMYGNLLKVWRRDFARNSEMFRDGFKRIPLCISEVILICFKSDIRE
jgi:hypothetical protein